MLPHSAPPDSSGFKARHLLHKEHLHKEHLHKVDLRKVDLHKEHLHKEHLHKVDRRKVDRRKVDRLPRNRRRCARISIHPIREMVPATPCSRASAIRCPGFHPLS